MTKIFENISPKNKEKLLLKLHTFNVNYKENTVISDILNDPDEIAIIEKGYIQIIQNNYNGTSNVIEELYEGDVFSLSTLFLSNSYDIITKEDCEFLLISYTDLVNFDDNDKVYDQFIKNLFIISNERLKEKNERIEVLTKKTIRNKLLEYFKIMSTKNGSRYIYLPFSFGALADYLAVDRCAMSREMKYLKEEGIIEVKDKRITLLYR